MQTHEDHPRPARNDLVHREYWDLTYVTGPLVFLGNGERFPTGAMLDLVLDRVLAAGHGDLKVALHLHDPHRYRHDAGRRWIDVARRGDRLSLLVDVQDPDRHILREDGGAGEIIFRCSEALASALIAGWDLDYTVAELTELPEGAALAHLPGVPGLVTLKAGNER